MSQREYVMVIRVRDSSQLEGDPTGQIYNRFSSTKIIKHNNK